MPALKGAQMLVWLVDDRGTGIVSARLSGQELQNGETALGQVRQTRSVVASMGLRERYIIVTLHNSGGRDYDERADFRFIEEAVREGWCEWTAWRDAYRLQREPGPAERFFHFTRETDTGLILAELGRAVVWEGDRLMLRILSAVGAEDRHRISNLTHGALRDRWLYKGRGWAGSRPFGFRRNPITKYIEVDPEQWPFVLRIHFAYGDLDEGKGHGLGRLSADLADQGCYLHPDRLRKILRNRIYVDGRWSVCTGEGEVVPQRTVRLASPVPEAVWQRNQHLLDLRRGKNSRTAQGEFCLNRVRVEHDRCAGLVDARGLRAYLAGRRQGARGRLDYSHSPWVPRQCHGFRLDRGALEHPVVQALWGLSSCPELLDAWITARRFAPERLRRDADIEQRPALQRRQRALARQRERLERYFVDRLASGDEVDERDYSELVAAVRAEEDQIRERLKHSQLSVDAVRPALLRRSRDAAGLKRALRDVLTLEPPGNPAARLQREALVMAMVSAVVVTDAADGVVLVLRSALTPNEAT